MENTNLIIESPQIGNLDQPNVTIALKENVQKQIKLLYDKQKSLEENTIHVKEFIKEPNLKQIENSIEEMIKNKEITKLEDLETFKLLENFKSNSLFSQILKFIDLFPTRKKIEIYFYDLITKANELFKEETIDEIRKTNDKVRILSYENSDLKYIGETVMSNQALIPCIMDGFGFFGSVLNNEYYIGKFKENKFMEGLWIKDKFNLYLGNFSYDENNVSNIVFDGMIINFENNQNEDNLNFLLGKFNFNNSNFSGIFIKKLNDNIEFNFGEYYEGKKNSNDFLTVKLTENKGDYLYQVIVSNYENDTPIGDSFIFNRFYVLKYNYLEEKFYSLFLVDGRILYRGETKFNNDTTSTLIEGNGIMIDYELNLIYHGKFLEGKKHGKGILYIQNSEDKKEGKLTRILEGEFVKGNFIKGNITDNGKLIIEDGEFGENLILQSGKLNLEDGELYDGSFLDNKRHGYGVYRYSDKIEYHGQWENGLKEGAGYLLNENRIKIVKGEWKENKLMKILNY